MEQPLQNCLGRMGTGGNTDPKLYVASGERAGDYLGRYEPSKKPFTEYNVHRATFLAELVKILGSVNVHLGARVVNVAEAKSMVWVTFGDGSKEHFDVVLGADGVRSVVRGSLFKTNDFWSQPLFNGGIISRALVNLDEAVAAMGKERLEGPSISMSEGLLVMCYPTDLGRKANLVCMSTGNNTWPHDRSPIPATREDLEETFCKWGAEGHKFVEVRARIAES